MAPVSDFTRHLYSHPGKYAPKAALHASRALDANTAVRLSGQEHLCAIGL